MIKKFITLTTLLLTIFFISSCYIQYDLPYGVWQSEDNSLLFDVNPENTGPHFGTYITDDGEKIDVHISFGYDKVIAVDKPPLPGPENGYTTSYFRRPFKVKNGKLYYGKKGDEDDVIIFNKIKDYEVP